MTTPPPPEKFTDLIWQQANYCWRRLPPGLHGFDLDDLFAEGLLVYARFLTRFDPARGTKFITGLTRCLMNAYGSILSRAHRHVQVDSWDDRGGENPYCDAVLDHREQPLFAAIGSHRLDDLADRPLSRDAWRVVRVALDPPAEWLAWVRTHRSGQAKKNLIWQFLDIDRKRRAEVERELVEAFS